MLKPTRILLRRCAPTIVDAALASEIGMNDFLASPFFETKTTEAIHGIKKQCEYLIASNITPDIHWSNDASLKAPKFIAVHDTPFFAVHEDTQRDAKMTMLKTQGMLIEPIVKEKQCNLFNPFIRANLDALSPFQHRIAIPAIVAGGLAHFGLMSSVPLVESVLYASYSLSLGNEYANGFKSIVARHMHELRKGLLVLLEGNLCPSAFQSGEFWHEKALKYNILVQSGSKDLNEIFRQLSLLNFKSCRLVDESLALETLNNQKGETILIRAALQEHPLDNVAKWQAHFESSTSKWIPQYNHSLILPICFWPMGSATIPFSIQIIGKLNAVMFFGSMFAKAFPPSIIHSNIF